MDGEDLLSNDSRDKSKFMSLGILVSGFIVSIIQPVILFLSGKDVNDAIWPHAYRTLQTTMWLRENLTLMFFLVLLMFFASLVSVKNKFKGKTLHHIHRSALLFVIGLISGFIVLYFLLDFFYLRGAFLLLPTLYGAILLTSILSVSGLPTLPLRDPGKSAVGSITHLLGVFFAAWLVMPGIPAMVGLWG